MSTERQTQRTRDIEFLSLIAHDLRQPLGVALSMGVLLDERWDALSDAQRRERVELMTRSAEWMKAILDDLDIAGEVASGSLHIDAVPFSLGDLVAETIGALGPAQRACLTVHSCDELPDGYGDVAKQRQVLRNLLENALRCSGDGSPIDVGLGDRGDMLVVTVADRGLGIAPEDVPTIFERFTRVAEADEIAESGSGLGLYVCRAMVNAQGGEIGVERNSHGVGSVFTYTLPIAGRDTDDDGPSTPDDGG